MSDLQNNSVIDGDATVKGTGTGTGNEDGSLMQRNLNNDQAMTSSSSTTSTSTAATEVLNLLNIEIAKRIADEFEKI